MYFWLSLLFNKRIHFTEIWKHVNKPENPEILSLGRHVKENWTELAWLSEKCKLLENYIIFTIFDITVDGIQHPAEKYIGNI